MEALPSVLGEALIVAHLVEREVRIANLLAENEWAFAGKVMCSQLRFESFEKAVTVALLVLGIGLALIVGEEGDYE